MLSCEIHHRLARLGLHRVKNALIAVLLCLVLLLKARFIAFQRFNLLVQGLKSFLQLNGSQFSRQRILFQLLFGLGKLITQLGVLVKVHLQERLTLFAVGLL